MLVGIKNSLAFATLDHNRHDLIFKTPFVPSLNGSAVGFECKTVLVFTRDFELFGDVFCGHTHVHATKRVCQRTNHHVGHFGVTHPCA